MGNYAADPASHQRQINAGYIDLLRNHADRYPLEASILHDPRISIAIDKAGDGSTAIRSGNSI